MHAHRAGKVERCESNDGASASESAMDSHTLTSLVHAYCLTMPRYTNLHMPMDDIKFHFLARYRSPKYNARPIMIFM